ncbi:MAG TPA: hypothetical protein VIV35_09865 [Chitinophagaceae bacterium]
MIEQTELVVTAWQYHPPVDPIGADARLSGSLSLEVMKKRTSTKKGIACRFSCSFVIGNETILEYVGEDSYVVDLPDIIDINELRRMIMNSYTKFKEKFDWRKLNTVLRDKSLTPLDEYKIDLDPILPLLE